MKCTEQFVWLGKRIYQISLLKPVSHSESYFSNHSHFMRQKSEQECPTVRNVVAKCST